MDLHHQSQHAPSPRFWHTQDSPQGMDPTPSSELSNQVQYSPTDYDGALSSQPLQHGYPTPSGQYQSRPLPPPPAAQDSYPAPAAPQPHLPIARSTQQYFPNHPGYYLAPTALQFLQPASHSEYSQSVYGTPQEHPSTSVYGSPAQTPGDQQMLDSEWLGNHTQMPGGYPPMSGSTTLTQHDQWSGFQPMTAETQNTYPRGVQPTPGPSTTAYPPYVPRPSITPTQQNHNQMSHWPNDQSMQTDDEDYRRKVPSRTSIRSGAHDQGTPSIPTHSGYQQGSPLPRVDLSQVRVVQSSKVRAVEHPDVEYTREVSRFLRLKFPSNPLHADKT